MFLVAPPYFRKYSVADATLSFVTSLSSTANQTSYTHTNASIGTAASDRLVIVIAAGETNTNFTVSSITIGGVTASLYAPFPSSTNPLAIGYLTVAAGTTADIVVTYSTGISRHAVGIWAAYGLQSTTPTDSDFVNKDAGPSTALNIDVSAGGVMVSGTNILDDSQRVTWTNATERYDAAVENFGVSGADFVTASATPGRTVTAGSANDKSMIIASWR